VLPNVINIETDEERGAYDMVSDLIARGHRRILHVAGPEDMLGAERRLRGYKRALISADIRVDPSLIISSTFVSDDGRDAMRVWLQQHVGQPLPHAVFCVCDGVATGCMEALAEAGLRVPDDISVAGFDDTLAARTTVPQLATVRQPLRAMGSRAVDVLMATLQRPLGPGSAAQPTPIVFPVYLVLRASVGTAPVVERIVPSSRVIV
jgi:LacI family transcriptional regulator